MYEEYKTVCEAYGKSKYESYDLFRQVFRETGYMFIYPNQDKRSTCDRYKLKKKHCNSNKEEITLQLELSDNIKTVDQAYAPKEKDK